MQRARVSRLIGELYFGVIVLLFSMTLYAAEYRNSNILISAEDAIKLIGKRDVLFISSDSEDVYNFRHIRGAVNMFSEELHRADIMGNLECAPLYRCIDDAEAYIGSKGIDNEMMLILYDDFQAPTATALYSFFKSYGHHNIKILNGGLYAVMQLDPEQKVYDKLKTKYRTQKRALEETREILKKYAEGDLALTEIELIEQKALLQENTKREKKLKKALAEQEEKLLVLKREEKILPKCYSIDKSSIDISHMADKYEVLRAVQDMKEHGKESQYIIIDARSMEEIIGDRKINGVARGGHIPGALFMGWTKTSDLEGGRSFKSADELQKVFDHYGVTPDKTIYAYSSIGSGRGSQLITALQLLGYENVKLFTGSWDSWANSMNFPVKK